MASRSSETEHLLNMLHDGKLTDKMISREDFDEIKCIVEQNNYGELLDPVYYYQNAKTIRVPDNELIIYKVHIPITGHDKYFLYSIDSLQIPVNNSETIKVNVPSEIAIHGQDNNIFIPSECINRDQQVEKESRVVICNPIHLVTEKEKVCINAILSRTRITVDCDVEIKNHPDNNIIVERAGPNAYYLSVFEEFHADIYCQDSIPKRVLITKGVWKIVLNGRCQLTAGSIKLRSIILLSTTIEKLVQNDVIVPAIGLLQMYRQSIRRGKSYKHNSEQSDFVNKIRDMKTLPNLEFEALQTQKPLTKPNFDKEFDIPWISSISVLGIAIPIFILVILIICLKNKKLC